MADPFTGELPPLANFLPPLIQPTPAPTSQATGTGDWFTAGLGSGFYGAGSQIGSAVQAGAKLVGADSVADSAKAFADRQRATANTYARPDLEANPWSLPGMGYQIAGALPAMAGFIGAGALAAADAPLVPEEAAIGAGVAGLRGLLTRPALGAAAAAFPLAVGQNVQTSEDANGPLTQGEALKAIALGVPEAALQGIVPGHLESILAKGIGGGVMSEALKSGATQAGVGAVTAGLTSLMGDPNRTFADRANDMLQAALGGAFQGAVFGGALGVLAKRPPGEVKTTDLDQATAAPLGAEPLLQITDQSGGQRGGQMVPRAPGTDVAVPPEQGSRELTDPSVTPPAPPSNALPGPEQGAPQLPPPAVRPFGDREAFPDAKLKSVVDDALAHIKSGGELTEQQDAALNQVFRERAMREHEDALAQPAIENKQTIYQPGEVEQDQRQAPDVIKAGPPDDIPSKPFAQLSDEELTRARANDPNNPDILKEMGSRVTPETRAADLSKQVRQVAKQVPEFLKGQTFTNVDDLRASIAQEIQRRYDANKPLGVRIEALDEHFKVTDDNGKPLPELLAKKADVVGATSDEPAPAPRLAPSVDAIPAKHQAKFNDLEKLREALAHENIPDKMGLLGKVDDLQSRLQSPGAGDVGRIVKETKALNAQVEGAKAGAARQAAEPPVTPARTPVPEGTAPTAKAQQAVEKIKVKQAAAESVKAPETVAPKSQAEAKAKTAAAVDRFAQAKVDTKTSMVKARLDIAKSALAKLYEQGKVLGGEQNAKGSKAFTDQLNEQSTKLSQVIKAASSPEGLAKIKEDHFGTALWDNHEDLVDAKTQKLLAKHADAEQDVIEAIQNLRGETPRAAPASDTKTQGDVDIAHLVSNGASGGDVLRYIRSNGSSGDAREMAGALLQHGVDFKVKFATPDGVRFDNNRMVEDGLQLKGSYNSVLDRVNLYDSSDMEQTLLHEGAHAATLRAIENGTPAGREMQALFDRLKARSPDDKAYGLTNAQEMVAEAFSNPAFRDFLKGERASSGNRLTDMWQAFKNTVFKALGMGDRVRSAFDDVMDTSGRLMNENSGKGFDSESPLMVDRKLKGISDIADRIAPEFLRLAGAELEGQKLNWTSYFRKQMMNWMTGLHIGEVYGKKVTGIKDMLAQQSRRSGIEEALTRPLKAASNLAHALDAKKQALANKVMQHTILNMDLSKSWAENRWLHAPEKATQAQKEQARRLQQQHAEGQKVFNEMAKDPAALTAYEKLRDANRANAMAKLTHHMVDLVSRDYKGFGLKQFDANPFDEYTMRPDLHDDPSKSAKFWQDHLTAKLGELDQFSASLKAKIDGGALSAEELANAKRLRSPVSSLVGDVQRTVKSLGEGPYFHLGRSGTHFVAAKLNPGADGLPNPADVQKLQATLEKSGFSDVAIQHNAETNRVYVKTRDLAETQRLDRVFRQLHEQGLFDKSEGVAAGAAEKLDLFKHIAPGWMKRAIETLAANKPEAPDWMEGKDRDAFNTAQDQLMRQSTQALMDMLPDNSLTKVYQRREGVQGFKADMLHSFDVSSLANSRGISGMAVSQDLSTAGAKIKDEIKNLNRDPKLTPAQREAYSQAAAEMIQRDAQRQYNTPSPGIDWMKKMAHRMQIGMSPAYFVTLMTQIPSLSLPKLGSTHGFLASARELAAATPEAMAVVRSVFNTPDWRHFGLSYEAMTKDPKISDATRDFIMHQAGMGTFNQGGYSNSMIGHGDSLGGKYDKFAHTMDAMSTFAEQIPRVLTALAAKKLWRGEQVDGPLHDFVAEKVNGSQLNWNPAFNPRAVGKQGAFGVSSPLVNQFMGYQIRLTELLYRQVADAVGGSPAEQAVARKFLLGHLAAVTAMAGTLGLPMVGVAASVYDRLADWATGKDDHDVVASYRTHLANTFGRDVGEIIARGLPRSAGFDLSKAGEGNILPGSTTVNMLFEKRKLEDAEKDWLKSMSGSAVGVSMNYLAAVRDFANGDYMAGSIKVAPEGFKNIAEAVQLGHRGFVTKDGSKLPITASAQDIALKVLGLEGAKEEEYNEVKRVESGLKALSSARSANITNHLLQANQRGDTEDFQKWARESAIFGRDHLGQPQPIMDFGKAMMERMQGQSMARALNTPLGVKPTDLTARGMTSFGNFQRQ